MTSLCTITISFYAVQPIQLRKRH